MLVSLIFMIRTFLTSSQSGQASASYLRDAGFMLKPGDRIFSLVLLCEMIAVNSENRTMYRNTVVLMAACGSFTGRTPICNYCTFD